MLQRLSLISLVLLVGLGLFFLALGGVFSTQAEVLSWSMLALVLGYTLDRLLGDPNSWHPIVGMGRLIGWGEHRFNHGSHRMLKGALYNGGLVVLTFGIVTWVVVRLSSHCYTGIDSFLDRWTSSAMRSLSFWLEVVGIFLMLSGTTLVREVREVFIALEESLEAGRRQVARIVGRDTASLDAQEVRTAGLETLSENLSDGVIAPLFWWMLLGLPGMVAYKMINTQDSMVGYKNARYRDYGCFSARLDDVVNYLPARLTAFLMLLSAGRLDLLPFVRHYGRKHASPNSGYPESALAGVLDCRFGGPHDYFGETVDKPYIGSTDRALTYEDMLVAVRLNRRSELLMVLLALLVRSALLLLAL